MPRYASTWEKGGSCLLRMPLTLPMLVSKTRLERCGVEEWHGGGAVMKRIMMAMLLMVEVGMSPNVIVV